MDSHCIDAAKARRESNLTTPPPHKVSKQPTSKPKKHPSVTPKRFKKFFTPSSALLRGARFGVSRLALGEITASATNRRERRLPQKVIVASTTATMEDAAPRAEDLSRVENGNTVAAVTDEIESTTRAAYDLAMKENSYTVALGTDEIENATRAARDPPSMENGNIVAFIAGDTENARLEAEVPTMANSSALLSSEQVPVHPNSLKRKRNPYGESEEDEDDDEDRERDTQHSDEKDEFAGLCQEDREVAMFKGQIYEDWKDMRELYREVKEEHEQMERDASNELKPVVRSKYRGLVGAVSRRELDIGTEPSRRPRLDYANNWQTQTANFYSRPNDTHVCQQVYGPQPVATVPFCTTNFNTITLVAVGDEDGGVHFLDSDKIEKVKGPGFPGTFLDFKPHNNAVLTVTLSANDRLLATGSGDQTSQIIDVMTRHTTHTLRGHTSSVKHVQFQPGSSDNVVATCSRDGSVKIWDLRINPVDGPQAELQTSSSSDALSSLGRTPSPPGHIPQNVAPAIMYPDCFKTLRNAHTPRPVPYKKTARNSLGAGVPRQSTLNHNGVAESRSRRSIGAPNRRGPASITAMAFLDPAYPHLLITGSEANACVKIWDIRGRMNNIRTHAVPVSTTLEPEAHLRTRPWGVVSMAVSPDRKRLYTLTRDSTVYAYCTSHLILGKAPEFRREKPGAVYKPPGEAQDGLGPVYGFRHPKLFVSTFYAQMAIRPAGPDQSELLAVGSHENCAVIFPTDERYMRNRSFKQWKPPGKLEVLTYIEKHFERPPPSFFQPPKAKCGSSDTVEIWDHGTALTRGHVGEVTGVCWSTDGELVTVSDDETARIWREDAEVPRKLRMQTRDLADRHDWAWSEVINDYDGDE
ncbi:hypothetical protein MMC30_004997 [Trapelia coarctata]|nr:hypothetical protein [Trapelia coarctata]